MADPKTAKRGKKTSKKRRKASTTRTKKKRAKKKTAKKTKRRGRPRGKRKVKKRGLTAAKRISRGTGDSITLPIKTNTDLMFWSEMMVFLSKNKNKSFMVQMDGMKYSLKAF